MWTRPKDSFRYMLIFLCLIVLPSASLSAQGSRRVTITGIDEAQFPEVRIQFRAVSETGLVNDSVSKDGLAIIEDGIAITPDSFRKIDGPVWVHFVVDAGAGLSGRNSGRWDFVANDLREYADSWQRPMADQVALTFVQADSVVPGVEFTGDPDELRRETDAYTPVDGTELSAPLIALSTIVDELARRAEATGHPQFVIFYTAGLEIGTTAQLEAVIRAAQRQDVIIHTKLLRERERPFDAPIQRLALETGGHYLNLADDSLIISDIFEEIAAFKAQYELFYRSPSGVDGTREVELQMSTGEIDTADYTVDIAPPRPVIERPDDDDMIVRESDVYIEDLRLVEPTEIPVSASIRFPDGFVRFITQADLLVNNEVVDTIGPVELGTQRLTFTWGLEEIQSRNTAGFDLQVEIRDELGFIATSEVVPVTVELSVPPPPTEVPAEPTVPAQPPDSSSIPQEDESLEGAASQALPVWLLLLSALLLVIVSGVGVYVWMSRQNNPGINRIRETAVSIVAGGLTRMTRMLNPNRNIPKAYLLVISGDETSQGKMLEIFGDTTIGRDRSAADLLFQQTESESPISRLHCTIIDDEDRFRIRDDDSVNGTYLNGSRLEPMREEELEDGDEIEIVRVERGGVKLLFQLADIDGSAPEKMRETKRVFDNRTQMGDESSNIEDRF